MTSMKNNDWKDRLNVVYSTNPDFGYEMDNDEEQVTLAMTEITKCGPSSEIALGHNKEI